MNTKQCVKSIAQTKDATNKQPPKKSGLPKGVPNKFYNTSQQSNSPGLLISTTTPATTNDAKIYNNNNSSKLQSISNSSIPSCNTDSKTSTTIK